MGRSLAAVRRFARRMVARSTVLRVLSVLAVFAVALLPRWLRFLPIALALIPGPLDEGACIALVLVAIALRPALRASLAMSLRLTVGARHLTAANEYVHNFA